MRQTHVLSSSAQKESAKLASNWEGPYEIIGVKPPKVYILDMGTVKVHVTEIKKYCSGFNDHRRREFPYSDIRRPASVHA